MNFSHCVRIFASVAAIGAMPAMAAVQQVANPADGSFIALGANPMQPGVYGVETRIGNNATNGTWEIGVGQQTSVMGSFNQAQFAWNSPVVHDFTLVWTPAGLSFTVGGVTVTDTGVPAPVLGNALKIDTKRDADVLIQSVDGVAFGSFFPGGEGGIWYSPDNWGGDGFSVMGTVRIGPSQGANSSSGVNFKVGTFTPNGVIPEPATWAMLIVGFGLVGASLRRRAPVAE